MTNNVKNKGAATKYELSKTKYCKGLQCPKMLWLDDHAPQLATYTFSESRVDTGKKVGALARGYLGKYDLVPYNSNKQTMCAATAAMMQAGADNIAEASFIHNGLYCAADILHRNGDGWDIVEVKNSTKLKDDYFEDMAF